MNSIDTIKYVKNNLELITLKSNVQKNNHIIYIEDLKIKQYPDMDIVLYGDINNFTNPEKSLMIPILTGKLNNGSDGMFITLNSPTEFTIPFNAVLGIFTSFDSKELLDNELPSVLDIMNMIDKSTDNYEGTKLISRGIPSLIDGDTKLKLSSLPYKINSIKQITNDYNTLFYLVYNESEPVKEFNLKVINDTRKLNIELTCLLNDKQSTISVINNKSFEDYIDNTEFNLSKQLFIDNNDNKLNLIAINIRCKHIEDFENVTVEITKQSFEDIKFDIEKSFNLLSAENILFNKESNLNFNQSTLFYSTDYKRETLIEGDLFRNAKKLGNIDYVEDLSEGIYFCNDNYGENLPLDLPNKLQGLWYVDIKKIGNITLQTLYDLTDIKNLWQRSKSDFSEFRSWVNVYNIEHKHKATDIIETSEKNLVSKKEIDKWNKTVNDLKYTNILIPVNTTNELPQSTEELVINNYSLCYVKSLKSYKVFDNNEWNDIDINVYDYNESIDIDNCVTKTVLVFNEDNIDILLNMLSIDYKCISAILSVQGNTNSYYQNITITDNNNNIHEFIRSFIKTNNEFGGIWVFNEISFNGHKHKTTDISEDVDKFFMTKNDKKKLDSVNKNIIHSVNTFLNLKDVDTHILCKTNDTQIVYHHDITLNKWNPISVNSLNNVDDEIEDTISGLLSTKYFQKIKQHISDHNDNDTLKHSKEKTLYFGINDEKLGKYCIDLTNRDNYGTGKIGDNSVTIGNNIYNYCNNSVLIGNENQSTFNNSVLIGNGLISTKSLIVLGNYNIDGNYALTIANGTDEVDSNLFTVNYDGLFETSEKGGYSIKECTNEHVLLGNGEVISIYFLYKIIKSLYENELQIVNKKTLIEGLTEERVEPISLKEDKQNHIGMTNIQSGHLFNNLLVKLFQDINEKSSSF